MRKGPRERGGRRVAAGLGLLLGTMAAQPGRWPAPTTSSIWEQGTVTSVSDGDTLDGDLDAGSGSRGDQRIRTIGVQAPEVAHNGTAGRVRLRPVDQTAEGPAPGRGPRSRRARCSVTSNDDYSGGRIVRSLYAQDEEGNWYDTSRGTVSEGWLLWFPLAADSSNKPEWAHNLEYRVLADDAASQARGPLDPEPVRRLAVPGPERPGLGASTTAPRRCTSRTTAPYDIDLSGWIIRDSAISGYRTLPAGTVIAGSGGVREVYSGDMNLNNLPADNAAFEGDAVYLMEPAGAPQAQGTCARGSPTRATRTTAGIR